VNDQILFKFNLLILEDHLELAADHLSADTLEIEPLASRLNRRQHLIRLCRRKDKLNVFRRLFEDLQQCVEGTRAEHVDFVDDINLKPSPCRPIDCILPELPDIIHAGITGTVDLNNIDVLAGIH